MKKYLFLGLAALSLITACNKTVVVNQPNPQTAIGFDSFTNKATKGVTEVSNNNLFSQFLVWGGMADDASTVTNFGAIFNAQPVNGNNGTWTYSPLRYWVPGNAYSFTALAPSTNGNLPTGVTFATEDVEAGTYLTKYNGVLTVNNGAAGMNGNVDLVWSSVKVSEASENMLPVNFTFEHILSQVNLKFVNCFPSDGTTIEISDVVINGNTKGSIDFDEYAVGTTTKGMSWELDETKEDRSFLFDTSSSSGKFGPASTGQTGATESGYRQTESWCTMPSQQAITVSFTVTLYSGDVEAGSWDHEHTLLLDADNLNAVFKPGYKYTLVANLDADHIADDPLNPIEFTVIGVENWENESEVVDYLYSLTLNPNAEIVLENTTGANVDVNVASMTPTTWDASSYSALATSGCTYEWSEDNTINPIFTIAPSTATALPATLTDIKANIALTEALTESEEVGRTKVTHTVTLLIKTAGGEVIAKANIPVSVAGVTAKTETGSN